MSAIVRMPEVATGAAGAAVASWLVEVGASVSAGQAIVEIETEKAVVEFEAGEDGVLAGILLPAGEAATVGSPIAVIATNGQSAEEALAEAGADSVREPESVASVPFSETGHIPPPAVTTASTEDTDADATADTASETAAPRLFASPLVRRLARERGIDLSAIAGSGPHGRVVRRDLDALTSAGAEETRRDAVDRIGAETAPYTDTPHTGMRRAIARRLTESKVTVPHFYLVARCRVDELLALRARINEQTEMRVSVNDLVIKAVATAMQDVPDANAIWTDDATRRFAEVDIAVAVSVPNGLLTPVLRGVQRMPLGELSSAVRDLAERARAGRLKQSELEGGSFSVSNLGMYGTTEFSAIINPPHAGILAIGAAAAQPVVQDDGSLGVATIMTVTLSADHRVLDGALAAQWLSAFQRRIENPVSMLV